MELDRKDSSFIQGILEQRESQPSSRHFNPLGFYLLLTTKMDVVHTEIVHPPVSSSSSSQKRLRVDVQQSAAASNNPSLNYRSTENANQDRSQQVISMKTAISTIDNPKHSQSSSIIAEYSVDYKKHRDNYIKKIKKLAERDNRKEYLSDIYKVHRIDIAEEDFIKFDKKRENDQPPYFRVIELKELIQIIIILHNPVNKDCVVCEHGSNSKLAFTFEVLNPFAVTRISWKEYYDLNMVSLFSDDSIKYLIICGLEPKEQFRYYIVHSSLSIKCTRNPSLDGRGISLMGGNEKATCIVEVEKCLIGLASREFFVVFTSHPSAALYEQASDKKHGIREQIYLAIINYWSLIVNKKRYDAKLPELKIKN
ncbi:unnamed protein product [Didymodactylos carnosus]|uniref:Uncharacterized protein n=1 Tax=Didymodactylos carnosus TaxID=1234261 RepID=A0A8S2EDK0_9BILA|nr:unnamed protein product [Didymodactylos carnosus]CAF3945352.1 unnamed protein product [Didymodactylos carnosus]